MSSVTEEELSALRHLEESCARLQTEGKHFQALENLERALVLRQHLFGADAPEVWESARSAGELCNLLAMAMLQQNEKEVAFDLLRKAEVLSARDASARAVTLNNWGCYYRKEGKAHTALLYLEKALRVEAQLTVVANPGDVNLNLAAVHSQLGRHSRALEHAETGLRLLQSEVADLLAADEDARRAWAAARRRRSSAAVDGEGPGTDQDNDDADGDQEQDEQDDDQEPPPPPNPRTGDRVVALVIAYYNVGAEQEFLRRGERAFRSYRAGYDLALEHLGRDHSLTQQLLQCCMSARDQAETLKQKKKERRARARTRAMGEEQPPGLTSKHWRVKPRLLLDPNSVPAPRKKRNAMVSQRLLAGTAASKNSQALAAAERQGREEAAAKETAMRRRSSAAMRRRSGLAGPPPAVYLQHAVSKAGLEPAGECAPLELFTVLERLPLGLTAVEHHQIQQELELVDTEPVRLEDVLPTLPDVIARVLAPSSASLRDWCTVQYHGTALYYNKREARTQHQTPLAGPYKGVPAFAGQPMAHFLASIVFRAQQEYDDQCANAALEAEAEKKTAPRRLPHGHMPLTSVRAVLQRLPLGFEGSQVDHVEFLAADFASRTHDALPCLEFAVALPAMVRQAFEDTTVAGASGDDDDWRTLVHDDGTSFLVNRRTMEARDELDTPEDIGEADVLEFVARHYGEQGLEPDAPWEYARFWSELAAMPFGVTPQQVELLQELAEFDSSAQLTWQEAGELIPDLLAGLFANNAALKGEWCRLSTPKGRAYAYSKRTGEVVTHVDVEEVFKAVFKTGSVEDDAELPWRHFWTALADSELCLTEDELRRMKEAVPVPKGEPVTIRVSYLSLQHKLRDLYAAAAASPKGKKRKKKKSTAGGSRRGSRRGSSAAGSAAGSPAGSPAGSRRVSRA